MSNYLVIAHQTAQSYELEEALKRITDLDSKADFTLLVPITYAGFLVMPGEGDEQRVVARARRVGREAAASLNGAGVRVSSILVGDELPMIALEEELADHPEEYQEIIFCTLPAELSRWLRQDQVRQAENRFHIPVRHIIGMPTNMPDPEIN